MSESAGSIFLTYLVDDDEAICASLSSLFEVRGLPLKVFSSAESFLAAMPCQRPACLLLDEQLPGMSGNQLLANLNRRGIDFPVILISAFADRGLAVSALRQGALTVLGKPIEGEELFAALDEAQKLETARLKEREEFEMHEAIFASLNPGELEVMRRIVAGEQNKSIAYDLGVSMRTIELRRHNIFRKLGVDGVAELVKRKLRYIDMRKRFGTELSPHDKAISVSPVEAKSA